MYLGYMYLDIWYFVLVIPAIIVMIFAQIKVKGTFSKYSKVPNEKGITGAKMAELVLKQNGLFDVRVERLGSNSGDHYDPKTKTIRLSCDVYDNPSVTAVGVAAHEAGHALQHSDSYVPLTVRNAVIPATNAVSWLPIPLIILSVWLSVDWLFKVAILILLVTLFVQLITLPVEFNASRRAVASIRENNTLNDDELRGAKKVLSAAAMTYVAAFLVSLMNILRIILIFSGRRKN